MKDVLLFGKKVQITHKGDDPANNLTPSIAPKDAYIPVQLFEYSPAPVRQLRMKECKESYSFMMEKLNYLAERASEYAKLPADHPERLRFEYRHQILVHLFVSANRGILNLDQIEKIVSRWPHYSSFLFRDAVLKAIDELGIVL